MLWLTVLIYWAGELRLSTSTGMQALVLPLAAACALLPALFPACAHSRPTRSRSRSGCTCCVAMLAYSLFTIAALHATLMALPERRLHGRHAAGPLASHAAAAADAGDAAVPPYRRSDSCCLP